MAYAACARNPLSFFNHPIRCQQREIVIGTWVNVQLCPPTPGQAPGANWIDQIVTFRCHEQDGAVWGLRVGISRRRENLPHEISGCRRGHGGMFPCQAFQLR